MKSHVESFDGKKYPLRFSEANFFSRDDLALVMTNYLCNQEPTQISGALICSEKAQSYSEIFSLICPQFSFKDFFGFFLTLESLNDLPLYLFDINLI